MSNRKIAAVILGGGSGSRLGPWPKQFLDLAGEPLIVHSLDVFDRVAGIEHIVVVVPDEVPLELKPVFKRTKVVAVTPGGTTRQASLDRGLNCLPEDTQFVVVHDAARPLLRPALIERLLDRMDDSVEGVIPAVAMDDAVKEVSLDGLVLRSRSREVLRRAQTPQVFSREFLEEALAKADAEGYVADDCSDLVQRAGGRIAAIEGDRQNIKITYAADLQLAEQIIKSRRGE